MKFSIITVCKNSEATIENTILSVINQTYKNYEYIIIDGVSTDNTLSIIEKYQSKIQKLTSEPDKGLYDAMNKGIKLATGDYLFFLNSDDTFWSENTLESTSKITQNNQKELLYGDQAFLNKGTGSASVRKHSKLNRVYLLKNTPCQPATFYRRDVFSKYGNFNTDFRIVSDQEWFLRAFLNYRISSHYLGFPITVFNTGGLSTGPAGHNRLNRERDKMFAMYFSPAERKKLEFISRYLRCFSGFLAPLP